MIKYIQCLFVTLVFANTALADPINTVGYEVISELKVFSTSTNIYFESNQEHKCSGDMKTRFVGLVQNEHHTAFLLSAFVAKKPVQLQYYCNDGGTPMISGIRIRHN